MMLSVVPERADGLGIQSQVLRACFWIPGSLAVLAPRNDAVMLKG
jgi:hypothetical protein